MFKWERIKKYEQQNNAEQSESTTSSHIQQDSDVLKFVQLFLVEPTHSLSPQQTSILNRTNGHIHVPHVRNSFRSTTLMQYAIAFCMLNPSARILIADMTQNECTNKLLKFLETLSKHTQYMFPLRSSVKLCSATSSYTLCNGSQIYLASLDNYFDNNFYRGWKLDALFTDNRSILTNEDYDILKTHVYSDPNINVWVDA